MTRANPQRVGLIGLGEVGQILAEDLVRLARVPVRAWDRLFPVEGSVPQRALRSHPALEAAHSMAELVRERSVIVCAVTADQCLAAASEAAQSPLAGSYYLDLNSVSPEAKGRAADAIDAAGGLYVEAAVMSPIGPKRSAAPICLGGPHASHFLPIAQSLGFTGASVYSEKIGAASAAKMCRSIIIKGMEALLAESLLTARRYGVEDTVLASLTDLLPLPDWNQRAHYMISRSLLHGQRRAEEMAEAARTAAHVGVEPWMSRGCSERQRWASEHAAAVRQETLVAMLDEMLSRAPAAQKVSTNDH